MKPPTRSNFNVTAFNTIKRFSDPNLLNNSCDIFTPPIKIACDRISLRLSAGRRFRTSSFRTQPGALGREPVELSDSFGIVRMHLFDFQRTSYVAPASGAAEFIKERRRLLVEPGACFPFSSQWLSKRFQSGALFVEE
jgi:hypothetical protein